MSEDTSEQPKKQPTAEKIGYLKIQYRPKRSEAEKRLLAKGVKKDSPDFRKSRTAMARWAMEKEYEGEIDTDTGLLNRKGFMRRAREEAGRARREGEKLWLFYLDLNDLKKVNDIKGHQAGDELLKEAAETLTQTSRASDVIARIGGDEFVVLIRGKPDVANEPEAYWSRIKTLFDQKGISVAAGLTELNLLDIKGSLDRADAAMYEAKEHGKSMGINAHLVRD